MILHCRDYQQYQERHCCRLVHYCQLNLEDPENLKDLVSLGYLVDQGSQVDRMVLVSPLVRQHLAIQQGQDFHSVLTGRLVLLVHLHLLTPGHLLIQLVLEVLTIRSLRLLQ